MGEVITCFTPRSRTLPNTAMLSASVPPLVKTISPGAQFSSGHHAPRLLDAARGLAPEGVDGAGVAVVLAHIGQHGLDHLGVQLRGGGVVEVDAFHGA
jgi:hypothetical protein